MSSIEAIFPLPPIQQGILFHSLAAQDSGIYVGQTSCLLAGELDTAAFVSAWKRVVERHAILRTAFVWEEIEEPVQVVHEDIALPFEEVDWRHLSAAEQEDRLQAYLAEDWRRAFELTSAPLMRLVLFRVGERAYRFVWSSHHLLLDGWSKGLILSEVLAFYENIRQGRELDLPAPRPYLDYVLWLGDQDHVGLEPFWRDTLTGFRASIQLEEDGRHADSVGVNRRRRSRLSADATAALQRLARDHHLPLNACVQAAWGLLLSRWSGRTDIVFGVVLSGRPESLAGSESMVGLFINTLPLRLAIDPATTVRALLEQAHARQLELLRFQHSSLADVQSWSDVEAGESLFETILAYENYPVDESLRQWNGSLTVSDLEVVTSDNYPLTVTVTPGRELLLEILYDARHFGRTTTGRMLRDFHRLLERLAARPSEPVEELLAASDVERHQVLVEWNDTAAVDRWEPCLHQLLEASAARNPEAVAARCDQTSLSFRELDARSNQLGRWLRARGVGPEVLVGVLLEPSLEMVVAVLGVLKTGGAYLPLDPSSPTARLAFQLSDAGAEVLLTQEDLATRLLEWAGTVMALDRGWGEIAVASQERLDVTTAADNLAYVIYTSGSTGRPKGIGMSHRGVVNYLHWCQEAYGAETGAGVPLHTSIAFDLSLTSLFVPLLSGDHVVLAPGREIDTLGRVLSAMRAASFLKLTPAHMTALLETPSIGGKASVADRVIVGGEALTTDTLQRWWKLFPQSVVFNEYGPTEAAVGCCVDRFGAGWDAEDSASAAIGRPIPGMELYIVNRELRPRPMAVAGELSIAGIGVARGYLERPGLTAERFVPDPFSGRRGARLYRSGDLVRLRPDGKFEFLGRTDDQVKIRGFRIELGEIEAVLNGHPQVRAVAVVVREDLPGGRGLLACVAPARRSKPSTEELRTWVGERLPPYMVPARFLLVKSLPLALSGKVDRKSLITSPLEPVAATTAPQPLTPLQELVAGAFATVFQVAKVAPDTNFFDLGGHSLLATQLASRIRKALDVELPVGQVFATPTVVALARAVERLVADEAAHPAPPLLPAARVGNPPLSFAQERLWLIDRMARGTSAYNVPVVVRLDGPLEPYSVRAALNAIIARHEVLRTTFIEDNGQPVQRIQPSLEIDLPCVDLTKLDGSHRETTILQFAEAEGKRVFDLSQGPLAHALLLRCAVNEHTMVLNLHHIVTDGWSMSVLLREFLAFYQALIDRPMSGPSSGDGSLRAALDRAGLPRLPVQYADFAVWQRGWLAGDTLQQELRWWEEQLRGAPTVLELPIDRPRPAEETLRGAAEAIFLPPELVQALQEDSRRQGVTLFMTLLAAFEMLMARWTGQRDLLLGTAIANRNQAEIENLIGFFINTLVLRADLREDPSFEDLLEQVRARSLDAYAHQDLPFEKLVDELRPDRDLSRSPLFQVGFGLQNTPTAVLEMGALTLEPLQVEMRSAKFDLAINLSEIESRVIGTAGYNRDLFDATTIRRLMGHWRNVLVTTSADPSRRLAELSLLSRPERQQMLHEWSSPPAPKLAKASLQQLFEAQAEHRPGAQAVLYGEQALTYGELNEGANRLAHRLRDLGIGVESRVGLCLERTAGLVVTIVGIVKAGAAYVPLDPDFPPTRLAYLVRDSGIRVVVTEKRLHDERLSAALPTGVELVLLDDGSFDRTEPPSPNPPVRTDGGNLAYVIYTSGSTGEPKGVEVVHRGVSRLAVGTDYVRLEVGDRVGQAATATFDAMTFELWAPLLQGGCVVGIPKDMALAPEALADYLSATGVKTLFLTTALFNQVVRDSPRAFSPLRDVLFGGEAVDAGKVRTLLSSASPDRLLHVYGPTEGTTFATWQRVVEVADGAPTIPIGRSLAHTGSWIADGRLQLTPVGVSGELVLGGDGLMRGYQRRGRLTGAQLVPDPFSGNPGQRLYRTGDRVRQRPDGSIEFLGRWDHQVKVRGFRIEPGEIETALLADASVSESLVVAQDDPAGGKRLVAYVVAAGESQPLAKDLVAELEQRLPSYMVPAAIMVLPAWPLTPNGKIDRRALPDPRSADDEEEQDCTSLTPMEALVTTFCGEVLKIPTPSVEDSFFDLGGHSLLATQLRTRLSRDLGVDVGLQVIFETLTLADLAHEMDLLMADGLAAAAPPLVPAEREGTLAMPLSFAQERLWFLDRLTGGTTAYNVPVAVRLGGVPDISRLAAALNAIIARHATLRTTFAEETGQPVQKIHPVLALEVPLVDLTGLGGSRRETTVRALVEAEGNRMFDLSRGPLVRALLLRITAREHVLVFNLHHIVTDGWSMGVLIRELKAFYRPSPEQASDAGQDGLPELPVQYADFAAWQRGWLTGKVLKQELKWWRQQLAAAPQVLELPTDRPRPAVQSFRGAVEPIVLSPSLSQRLEALSRRQSVTLFMTLLAAYEALLSRWSGQQELLVGTPIANRNRAEIENLIGFFVNTLVLRGDLRGDPTFAEMLGRTRERGLGAFAHQDLPFEKLVEELQIERDLAHTPLFQAMFALQNAPVGALKLGDLTLEPFAIANRTATFDLTLSLGETDDRGLAGAASYNRDLFDPVTIRRLLLQFKILLEAALSDPETRLSTLPLMTTAQSAQLLVEWNDTGSIAAAAPEHGAIHELFEDQAALRPDALALVVTGETCWSYGELNRRANQLARRLRDLGVGPESKVALHMDRSAELALATIGVLKAGGAFLPLDPSYPQTRLSFMMKDADPRVLVTVPEFVGRLTAGDRPVLVLDPQGAALAAHSGENPSRRATADNLAYVIYTSGSTGRPKGTELPHRGLVNLVFDFCQFWSLGAGDRTTQVAAPGFDAWVAEAWPSLTSGAVLHIPDEETRSNPSKVLPWLGAERIDVCWLPTPLAEAVVREPWPRMPLRALLTAGDRLHRSGLKKIPAGLFNLYGPTEATVMTTRSRVTGGPLDPPIGRPIGKVRTYLLDRLLRSVPIGVAGELCVGGISVGRGYLKRPGLTAERFVPDPFAATAAGASGGRLYRTGDLARTLNDGEIEFLGRIDHQVKIRGFRIELGEIEQVLTELPGVGEAVVLALGESSDDQRLAAFLVPEGASPPATAELRRELQSKLPSYMVPSTFVMLDALPLTANGKIDRVALGGRTLPTPGPESEEEHVAPRTPMEELVAAYWSEVLGVRRPSTAANFFALGGHSLLATQVASRLSRDLGVEVPVRTFFETPTLAALARTVEMQVAAGARGAAPPLGAVARDGNPPLSFAQERLWFLDRLTRGGAVYNAPVAMRLSGLLELSRLRAALNAIIVRHETLRTTFAEENGRPVQKIRPILDLEIPLVDLTAVAGSQRETTVRELAEAEGSRGFDLSRGPLVRTLLLRGAEREHVMVFNLHHIVTDGWSMGILVRELKALYQADPEQSSDVEQNGLPELPVQYADFATWQRQWLAGEILEQELDWWRQQLAAAPHILALPTDRPRPAVQSFRGAVEPILLPPELDQRLETLSGDQGVTLFMTLLATFEVLLSRWSGQRDLLLGTPIANRNRTEIENLIGFFVNTLVLRGDLRGDPSFAELLDRVRDYSFGAYGHQDLPFERLVEELQVERDLAHTPLFQVMFAMQNTPLGPLELGDLTLEPLATDNRTAKFDLTLNLGETDHGLVGAASYNRDLFDRVTIRRLLGQFEILLEAAVGNPEKRLSTLPLMTAAQSAQLLVEWNDTGRTATALPGQGTSHELFEDQVARRPDAVAVVAAGEGCWSYASLNRRANQLAHHLHDLGVGPESKVALHMDRSAELVLATLAVLKAGGAFLPLDPSYPETRLSFMLEDADPLVLVTVPELVGRLAAGDRPVMILEPQGAALAGHSSENLPCRATAENLAYVIYTSGSTGRPKGAELTHRGLLNLVSDVRRCWDLGAGDRTTQIAAPGFDAWVFETWPSLSSGATLHLVDEEARTTAAKVLPWLAKARIDVSWLPTPLMEAVLDQPWPPALHLRALSTAGDRLHRAALKRIPQGFYNLYGPTEATVMTTRSRVAGGILDPPIGRPIENVRVYLLDGELRPVQIGVAGEVCVGGVSVGRGYLERPRLTAERFVPDPFASESQGASGDRMYRTGDLARALNDGEIEFRGRIDHQVKVRGFRIELGEIEQVLAELAAVREAVVLALEEPTGDKRLAAYVVPATQAPLALATLRQELQSKLPSYMVPATFVALDALPLTTNGKVDRAALSARTLPRAMVEYVAPRTAVEQQLATIWQDVLGLERVGIHDDFFMIGGHSLLATQVASQVAQRMDVELPLDLLFAHPILAELAAHLEGATAPTTAPFLVSLRSLGHRPPLFFAHAVGGEVVPYRQLTLALGEEQPVYGLRALGLEPGEEPLSSFADMAARYVTAIREFQPAGPYRLGGWSMGGVLAFEMARQLVAEGAEVGWLALFDSHLEHPGQGELGERAPSGSDEELFWATFAQEVGLSWEALGLGKEALEELAKLPRAERFASILGAAHAAHVLPSSFGLADLESRFDVTKACMRAYESYQAQPLNGVPTLLVEARDRATRDGIALTRQWQAVVREAPLRVESLPGDHHSLLVGEAARHLAECLLRFDHALGLERVDPRVSVASR